MAVKKGNINTGALINKCRPGPFPWRNDFQHIRLKMIVAAGADNFLSNDDIRFYILNNSYKIILPVILVLIIKNIIG